MQLSQRNRDTDAGQHAVHDGRRHRQAEPGDARRPEGDLDQATEHDGGGDQAPVAELLDQAEHDRGETGRRPCNLKRRTGDQAGDQAADDAGDEPGHDRRAGRERDAERQRDGDEEDDQ